MRKEFSSVFAILVIVTCLTATAFAQIEFIEHAIGDGFDGPRCLYATDIDSDGDVDIVAAMWQANDIVWLENDGEGDFTDHVINADFGGALTVYAADLDGDDDIDLMGTAYSDSTVAWWENDGDQNFDEHILSDQILTPHSIYAADMDGDEDIDVLAASNSGDQIVMWENDGNGNFEELLVGTIDAPLGVHAADVDDDGDVDVLSATMGSNEISWWENNGALVFTVHTIAGNFLQGRSVFAADVDSDGDMDVLGAATTGDDITWWENNGNQNFTEHIINGNFDGAYCVYAIDMDGDDDVDVLGAAFQANDITWWENDGEQDFTQHTVNGDFGGASWVFATDLDGDGDIDILGTATNADEIAWWEQDCPPEPFDIFEPVDDSLVTQQPVTLRWHSTTDPDGEEVIYCVQLATDEDFDDDEFYDTDEDTFYVFEEVEDDTDYWWRILAMDAGENSVRMSNQTWHFEVGIPPSEFDLLSPDSGSIHTEDEIELAWQEAIDPAEGEVVYDVYISDDPENLDDPVETDLTGTTYTFTPTNEMEYYWTVLARDHNTPGTWATSIWSFYADRPDLPSDFALLEPEDGTVIPFADPYEIETVWQSSTDPDYQENVTYSLNFIVTLDDGTEDTLDLNGLRDTTQTVNLPARLDLESWEDTLTVLWWVEAVSGGDAVESEARFTFYLEPNPSAVSERFNGLPGKFAFEAVYPNPFNPTTVAVIGLPRDEIIDIRVYNILGEQVAVLARNKACRKGYHKFTFNAGELSSGIYFIQAIAPGRMNEIRKVVLIR